MHDLARRVARTAYDRLGGMVALNLLWDLIILPWALAAYALIVGTVVVGGGPGLRLTAWLVAVELVLFSAPTALVCAAAGEWLDGRGVDLRHLVRTRARALVRAQVLGAAAASAAAVLGVNAVFYSNMGGWVGSALAGLMLWMLLGLQLVALYLLPAAVAPHTSGLVSALRQAAALAAGNLRFSGALLVLFAAIAAAGLASGVGLLVGLASVNGLLLTAAYRQLLAGQGAAPPRRRRDLLRPYEA